jgi:hypothetical protein
MPGWGQGPLQPFLPLSRDRWTDRSAIRGCWGSYWCELIPNGWADMPNDRFDALTFKTPEAAKAAFTLASVAYAEREARQKAAYAVLGIEEE